MAYKLLLSDSLAKPLHRPYQDGNIQVSVGYVLSRLALGPYRVVLKRNFDTACWVPPLGSRASHTIYYGDRMLDRVLEFFCEKEKIDPPTMEEISGPVAVAVPKGRKPPVGGPATRPARPSDCFKRKVELILDRLGEDQREGLLAMCTQAVASYGRHEREHARNTSQDMGRVKRDLKALKIAFTWFNLFEDARIEHRSRAEQGSAFGWREFEAVAKPSSPGALFLRCIQMEGEADTEALESEEDFGLTGRYTVGEAAESVQGYYKRACVCPTDEHLYPIIVEFLEEFKDEMPPEPEEPAKGEGEGSGEPAEGEGEGKPTPAEAPATDLSTAAEAAERGDDFFDEFEADAEVIGGTDEEGKKAEAKAETDEAPKGVGSGRAGELEAVSPTESGGAATPEDFLSDRPGELDVVYAKRVEDITNRLMRLFVSRSLVAATESPGRRLSGRHLARGELRFLHKAVRGGKNKRKYAIIYDCSGSMRGQPDREGKIFLLALNNIAKKGFLSGRVLLSGWVSGKPGWLAYDLPVADDVLLSVVPSHGHEGINHTVLDNLRDLKGYDDVFVYTDASITDAPMDQARMEAGGVRPVGLYVGEEKAATEMARHFPDYIIRTTIEDLIDKLLTRNRKVSA